MDISDDTGTSSGASHAIDCVLSDPDLLFQIASSCSDLVQLKPWFGTCRATRAAALRADLPLWTSCDQLSFIALEGPSTLGRLISRIAGAPLDPFSAVSTLFNTELCSQRWHCNSVLLLLRAKPRLLSLDLSGCKIASHQGLVQVLEALPNSLTSLSIASNCPQPDAALAAIQSCRERLSALPSLTALDLRGVFTERSLVGLRLLGRLLERARTGASSGAGTHSGASTTSSFILVLPHLQKLAVGFHTFSNFGQKFGESASRHARLRRAIVVT